MPNGRPGDHPFTDIVVHRVPTFTPEIDELVRELAGTKARDQVAELLWQQGQWRGFQSGKTVPNETDLNQRLLNELREIQRSEG